MEKQVDEERTRQLAARKIPKTQIVRNLFVKAGTGTPTVFPLNFASKIPIMQVRNFGDS